MGYDMINLLASPRSNFCVEKGWTKSAEKYREPSITPTIRLFLPKSLHFCVSLAGEESASCDKSLSSAHLEADTLFLNVLERAQSHYCVYIPRQSEFSCIREIVGCMNYSVELKISLSETFSCYAYQIKKNIR